MALVQTSSSINDLRLHLSTMTAEDLLGLQKKGIFRKRKLRKNFPEPDYQLIDKCLASVEKLSTIVEETKEPLSSNDRKYLKNLAVELFKLVEKVDLCIKVVEYLPDSVPWKQTADGKLVNLANRTEDIAEVCELAVDEEFIKMINDRLQKYLNARANN